MKVKEVPQDITLNIMKALSGPVTRLMTKANMSLCPATAGSTEEVDQRSGCEELAVNLEKTRKAVLAGQKSPLAYHMERRQMTPEILGKTAGIAVFRVKRHLRPEIFAKLKDSVLERYAKALAITMEELKTVPKNNQRKGNY